MKVVEKVIEEYELSECIDGVYIQDRVATIIFVNDGFDRCTYKVSGAYYTFADWMFLLKVAQKIKELQEEKRGGN